MSLEQLPITSLEHFPCFFFSQVGSLHTCAGDLCGVRVEWRDGGGCTHLVGLTELGGMLGNDPNMELSVLRGLGRKEANKHSRGARRATCNVGVGRGRGGSQQHKQQKHEEQQRHWQP